MPSDRRRGYSSHPCDSPFGLSSKVCKYLVSLLPNHLVALGSCLRRHSRRLRIGRSWPSLAFATLIHPWMSPGTRVLGNCSCGAPPALLYLPHPCGRHPVRPTTNKKRHPWVGASILSYVCRTISSLLRIHAPATLAHPCASPGTRVLTPSILQPIKKDTLGCLFLLVEAGGIEPPSTSPPLDGSTCLVCHQFNPCCPDKRGQSQVSRLVF